MTVGKRAKKTTGKPIFPAQDTVVARAPFPRSKYRPLACPKKEPSPGLHCGRKGMFVCKRHSCISHLSNRSNSQLRSLDSLRCCDEQMGPSFPKWRKLILYKRQPKHGQEDERKYHVFVAARLHCRTCLDKLLVKERQSEIKGWVDSYGRSIADWAVTHRDADMLEKAIALGSNPAIYTKHGSALSRLVTAYAKRTWKETHPPGERPPAVMWGQLAYNSGPFDPKTKKVFDILWNRADCQEALRKGCYVTYFSLCHFMMRNYEGLSKEHANYEIELGRGVLD